MQINTAFTIADINQAQLINSTAIIIDVLRATSTMLTAFSNGAKSILPCAKVSTVKSLALKNPQSLLCGERGGKLIAGFNLDNSPLAYKAELVSDQDLIFTTTNGTKAILAAKKAQKIYLGAIINAGALAQKLIDGQSKNIYLCCAATKNQISYDDILAAGVIIQKIKEKASFSKLPISLSDSSLIALETFYINQKNLYQGLLKSKHGQNLIAINHDLGQKDLQYCAKLDLIDTIAYYDQISKLCYAL